MTKQEAIENHRKMWNWIADETLKRERKVYKSEYFAEIHGGHRINIISDCFCCQYDFECLKGNCISCPIIFSRLDKLRLNCMSIGSPYKHWRETYNYDYTNASIYAKIIADLPEREDVE